MFTSAPPKPFGLGGNKSCQFTGILCSHPTLLYEQ